MNAKTYKVKNRSASMVVYTIPEMNVRREIMPGEIRSIPFEELEALSYQPGGRTLMADFLQLQAEEVTQELGIKREVEYDMSEEDIKNLILNGSLDEFLDCLDFAPIGIIDLIKSFAVELPMSDMAKADALKKKTGFDVVTALANIRKEQEDDVEAAATEVPQRRVQKKEAATKPAERRTTPKYTVVSK